MWLFGGDPARVLSVPDCRARNCWVAGLLGAAQLHLSSLGSPVANIPPLSQTIHWRLSYPEALCIVKTFLAFPTGTFLKQLETMYYIVPSANRDNVIYSTFCLAVVMVSVYCPHDTTWSYPGRGEGSLS